MKKLMIVLSLVFVASCGSDDLESCGDDYTFSTSTCVESSDSDAVEGQEVGDNQVQCTTTDGEGDDEKDYTCVKDEETASAALTACSGNFDFDAANDASPSKCAEASETDDVNGLTVGADEAKCTHTDDGDDYICVE